jgi:hypothetical protein
MDEISFSRFADIPAYFIVIKIHVRIKIFFFFGLKRKAEILVLCFKSNIRLIQYYFSDNKDIGLKEIYCIGVHWMNYFM